MALCIRRDHQLQQGTVCFLSAFCPTSPPVPSSQIWLELEIFFFCQISFPRTLEEPTHSADFKAKIPVVLEQTEPSAVVSAEALENLEVELIIDKSKTHFNTMLKSKHQGGGRGKKRAKDQVNSILIFPCCLNL